MAEQAPAVLDPLLPADFRAALVAGQEQHQVFRQACQVAQPRIRPAEVLDTPGTTGRAQEYGPFRPVAGSSIARVVAPAAISIGANSPKLGPAAGPVAGTVTFYPLQGWALRETGIGIIIRVPRDLIPLHRPALRK